MSASDLDTLLASRVSEAASHRQSVVLGDSVQGPSELHQALVRCRASLDRVEGIVAELTQVRGKTSKALALRTQELEDAWNEHATSRRAAFAHGDAAPRERYAEYSLATMDLERRRRATERDHRDVESALEVCRIYLRGLQDVRSDLHAALRALTFESRLEH